MTIRIGKPMDMHSAVQTNIPHLGGSMPCDHEIPPPAPRTRRHFFPGIAPLGLQALLALTSLLSVREGHAAAPAVSPLAPKQPHYAPKAKNVIFLFMAGGPSQLELFPTTSPGLTELHGQPRSRRSSSRQAASPS